MSKVWYCPNCGYEVSSRGRCHRCKQRLVASPLGELPAGQEDDEVGYRLNDWPDRTRGMLIEELIDDGIAHRFEEDELVVAAGDEETVDGLVEQVTAAAAAAGVGSDAPLADLHTVSAAGVGIGDEDEERALALATTLFGAARRLHADPTDMEADAEVAEASAAVFLVEDLPGLDDETWAAIGRVVRRLLAALGAEEALEEQISTQAGVLVKLLEPLVLPDGSPAQEDESPSASPAQEAQTTAAVAPTGAGEATDDPEANAGLVADAVAGGGSEAAGAMTGTGEPAGAAEESLGDGGGTGAGEDEEVEVLSGDGSGWEPEEPAVGSSGAAGNDPEQTVYELPGWLPEQRAELSLYLEEEDIVHEWDAGDLIVASGDEARTEALFDRIEGMPGEAEDEEARYRALEELFAAADRLTNDPGSETRAAELVAAVEVADGPTPVGLDDAQWWSIRMRAKTLSASIGAGANREIVHAEVTTLRDLLRALV